MRANCTHYQGVCDHLVCPREAGRDFTRHTRRTLYAGFMGDGTPVIGLWGWDKKKIELFASDRVANGEAFPGEHIVRCTVEFYDRKLIEHRLPPRTEVR